MFDTVTATIETPYMGWALILPIILNRRYLPVLYRGGVRGASQSSFTVEDSSWFCSRCTARADNLDGEGGRRSHELTLAAMAALDAKTLWDEYGIVSDLMVSFT